LKFKENYLKKSFNRSVNHARVTLFFYDRNIIGMKGTFEKIFYGKFFENFFYQILGKNRKYIFSVVFGTFPYWQVTSEKLEELIKINEYSFHDRQFYYTFVM